MPSSDYIPGSDQLYVAWLNNFTTVCADNTAALSLTPAELTSIQNASTTFINGVASQDAARNVYRGAVADKKDYRDEITSIVRKYAREFKANPAVSNGLLTSLGIVTSSASGPVTQVTGLQVTGCADGVNKLTWNRAGNSPQTIFIIEYKTGTETDWGFAAAITKTSFNHEDQTPGELVWYRIIASRAGTNAVPSLPVAAYGATSTPLLTVAA
jgi:hypothetical protein